MGNYGFGFEDHYGSTSKFEPIENIIHVPIDVSQVAGSTISALQYFQSGHGITRLWNGGSGQWAV